MKRKNKEDFINESSLIHGETIDLTNFNYDGYHVKGLCRCNICNYEWFTTPSVILRGYKCPKCSKIKKSINKRWSIDKFIEKARLVHGDKYSYSKTIYTNARTKIGILCNECQTFFKQLPRDHLQGHGCPHCKTSLLENEMMRFLMDNEIEFESQKRFDWLGRQSLDFFLPKYNIGIECQGRQHFEMVKAFGGDNNFELIKDRDSKKNTLCNINNVLLIYYLKKKYNKYMTNCLYINDLKNLLKYFK